LCSAIDSRLNHSLHHNIPENALRSSNTSELVNKLKIQCQLGRFTNFEQFEKKLSNFTPFGTQ
jgi:hypothetical protein